jgi:hypothetical protein
MKTTFYKKQGRRYVPAHEYDQEFLDSYPKGTHLVVCYPGGKSTKYHVDPNYAAMIAAGRVAEDAVTAAIVKSQECKPQRTPLTERQVKLWKELAESFNRDDYPVIRPAAADAGRAAVEAMMKEAEKLLKNPSVRKAYEQFILMCELTKEKELSE